MTNNEQDLVWVGACRYYLGRMTCAVSEFCDALVRHWPNLPEAARTVIQRDVERGFQRDDNARAHAKAKNYDQIGYPLGWDCDREQWEKVRELWRTSND